jgi:hypothetical protein
MSLVRRQKPETTRTAKAACRQGLFCALYTSGGMNNGHEPTISLVSWVDVVDGGSG